MWLKLGKLALCSITVSFAFAQSPGTYVQSDAFHIGNCATPCVAQLALSQTPVTPLKLFLNGVPLGTDLYQVDASQGPQQVVVSFSPAAGSIHDSDMIIVIYSAQSVPDSTL